jgi:hypothetical protein
MPRQSSGTANTLVAATNSLHLSRIQQTVAWAELSEQSTNQSGPSSFKAAVGSVLPASIMIQEVTKKTVSDVPAALPQRLNSEPAHPASV